MLHRLYFQYITLFLARSLICFNDATPMSTNLAASPVFCNLRFRRRKAQGLGSGDFSGRPMIAKSRFFVLSSVERPKILTYMQFNPQFRPSIISISSYSLNISPNPSPHLPERTSGKMPNLEIIKLSGNFRFFLKLCPCQILTFRPFCGNDTLTSFTAKTILNNLL